MNPNLTAFNTIVIKEVRRIMRIWGQTLVPPAITMTLYFLIFGRVVGSKIGSVGEFSYIQYIVPGLIMMSVITNAYGNVASSFFGSKFGRYVEELLVSPTPNWVILAGYVAGGVLRGLMVGVIVTLISLFFTHLHIESWLTMLSTLLLSAVIFSLAGFINATYARSFDDISIIPTFILTPLTYLGGVFYSLAVLPDVWQTVSALNPILYVVSAFRFGILGVSDAPLWMCFAVMLTAVGLLTAYSLHLLRTGRGLRA
jgi:ABC-2 type transport system permease protein